MLVVLNARGRGGAGVVHQLLLSRVCSITLARNSEAENGLHSYRIPALITPPPVPPKLAHHALIDLYVGKLLQYFVLTIHYVT